MASLLATACGSNPSATVGTPCTTAADCPDLVCDPATGTCQVSAGPVDAGTPPDAGIPSDASDAGKDAGIDAGLPTDAGLQPDVGTPPDAGLPGDAGGASDDAGIDAGRPTDAGLQPDAGIPADSGTRIPTAIVQTAGGGSRRSANYQLELYIAPTAPVGAGASQGYRLQLGPAVVAQ